MPPSVVPRQGGKVGTGSPECVPPIHQPHPPSRLPRSTPGTHDGAINLHQIETKLRALGESITRNRGVDISPRPARASGVPSPAREGAEGGASPLVGLRRRRGRCRIQARDNPPNRATGTADKALQHVEAANLTCYTEN